MATGNLGLEGRVKIGQAIEGGIALSEFTNNKYNAPYDTVALFIGNNEVTGAGYARVQITSWAEENTASGIVLKNGAQITFTAGANWGTVDGIGLIRGTETQPTTKDKCFLVATISKNMTNGTQLVIAPGALKISFPMNSTSFASHWTENSNAAFLEFFNPNRSASSLLYGIFRDAGGAQAVYKAELIDDSGVAYSTIQDVSLAMFTDVPAAPTKILVGHLNNKLDFPNTTGQTKIATGIRYYRGPTAPNLHIIFVPFASPVTHQPNVTLTFNTSQLDITLN